MAVHPPTDHLHAAGKLYPRAWEQIQDFRQARGASLPDWPNWCFLPIAAFIAIVSEGASIPPIERIPDAARLAAIGTWRYSQGIYRFDPDLYSSIESTTLDRELPAEVLFRLPEWCVYIETPGHSIEPFGDQHGFWAHLEHDVNSGRAELRILLNTHAALRPLALHIGKWTVLEGLDRMIREAERVTGTEYGTIVKSRMRDHLAQYAQHCLSLLLYLCSEQPDIERIDGDLPQRPKPKRTKTGWRMFAPDKPRVWKIGEAVGAKLRHQRSEHARRDGVAPHIRRAHWHGYWMGEREKEERRFIYKWLPPIFVGAKSDEEEQ